MNSELFQKLQYSHMWEHKAHQLPVSLRDSLYLISSFFNNSKTNKLSLVFPCRECVAQWLSIPTVFFLIETDFSKFKGEIYESYKHYKEGEKLILNNKAVVEWAGIKEFNVGEFNGPTFKTKHSGESSGVEITINFSDIIKLQKAPVNRQALSSIKTIKKALPSRDRTPIENLLKIDTFGNKEFIKNSICLVSKFKTYDNSVKNILLNHVLLSEYFTASKINEKGNVNDASPILISNNLSNLSLYLAQSKRTSRIIIDGYSALNERGTDFSDIDALGIPTILITDLSEIETFENIGNYGFEFFNFTKENLKLDPALNDSPFHLFEKKLTNYVSFNLRREICNNAELESVVQKVHSIQKDDSNNDLNMLKRSLIQSTNILSRIAYVPGVDETSNLNTKLNSIEVRFQQQRHWLGESSKPIEKTIPILKSVIEKFSAVPSEKCIKLQELLNVNRYDYIICPTKDEVKSLTEYINSLSFTQIPLVISVADVNDNLLSNKRPKAILTAWPKSNNINRILSSFLFSELTVLFYQFENKYLNSLQKKNRKNSDNIKSTVDKNGIRPKENTIKKNGFSDFYESDEVFESTSLDSTFDISDFELELDSTQYSKYAAKGNLTESIKAKRIDFENNTFIYATETHKFILINEIYDSENKQPKIYTRKHESLQTGDIISLINTVRDVLVELVERNTRPDELAAVKKWTELWKNLLREYYAAIGYDFKKLVFDLRNLQCTKHEVTIRTWLQDENRIGPDDDADLISISKLTNSQLLRENISTSRKAISQMTGWRIKAADFVRDKIKAKLIAIPDHSISKSSLEIPDLGEVRILKIQELKKNTEDIDKRFVNRLINKEII